MSRATRKVLEQHLAAVRARLAGAPAVEVDRGGDRADQVVEQEGRELALGDRDRLTRRAAALEAALDRLDAGDYGRCVTCGGEIPAARLRVVPEADRCVACLEQQERESAARRRRRARAWEEDEA